MTKYRSVLTSSQSLRLHGVLKLGFINMTNMLIVMRYILSTTSNRKCLRQCLVYSVVYIALQFMLKTAQNNVDTNVCGLQMTAKLCTGHTQQYSSYLVCQEVKYKSIHTEVNYQNKTQLTCMNWINLEMRLKTWQSIYVAQPKQLQYHRHTLIYQQYCRHLLGLPIDIGYIVTVVIV